MESGGKRMRFLVELLGAALAQWNEGVAAASVCQDRNDENVDCDAWEQERLRLTLSPWWL